MNVKIYSTPGCPWCKKAKNFLEKNDISFTDVDVSVDQSKAEEMIKKSGQMATPVIDIEGKIIVGFDEKRLKKVLGL
jgi:glutaredoxin-like YruB-family protein